MTNIRGIVIMPNGNDSRINVTYDELDADGQTVASLKRAVLTVSDNDILNCISKIDEYVKDTITNN